MGRFVGFPHGFCSSVTFSDAQGRVNVLIIFVLLSKIISAYQDKTVSKTIINCNEKIAPKEKLRC